MNTPTILETNNEKWLRLLNATLMMDVDNLEKGKISRSPMQCQELYKGIVDLLVGRVGADIGHSGVDICQWDNRLYNSGKHLFADAADVVRAKFRDDPSGALSAEDVLKSSAIHEYAISLSRRYKERLPLSELSESCERRRLVVMDAPEAIDAIHEECWRHRVRIPQETIKARDEDFLRYFALGVRNAESFTGGDTSPTMTWTMFSPGLRVKFNTLDWPHVREGIANDIDW